MLMTIVITTKRVNFSNCDKKSNSYNKPTKISSMWPNSCSLTKKKSKLLTNTLL